eukprot:3691385-Rhodomonas_salina.4
MSGTDLDYAATSSAAIAHRKDPSSPFLVMTLSWYAISLRACYAVSGIEILYVMKYLPTRVLCHARFH